LYLYGPGGQLLSACPVVNGVRGACGEPVYFAGRLLFGMDGNRVYTDRLGTVRAVNSTPRNYYPFGEEIGTPTANNTYKFASTYRDSATGLDYALNRYYASGTARFLTPDPAKRSARLRKSGSWNRYTYGSNDPISRADPLGLDSYLIGDDDPDIIVHTMPDSAPCGPGWMWNAALRGPCTDIIIDIGTIAASTSNAPAPPQYYLKKTRDCYSHRNGPNITREVSYSLWIKGEDGEADKAATGQPNEFVWEFVTDNSTGLATNLPQPQTGDTSGLYPDQQSLGGLAKSNKERWLTQRFFLGTQTKYDFNAPLSVEGWGSRLLIHQTSEYVTINGDRGGTTDKGGQWHPNMCPP
jgi:RHS repeat-associated protein